GSIGSESSPCGAAGSSRSGLRAVPEGVRRGARGVAQRSRCIRRARRGVECAGRNPDGRPRGRARV
ncbi:MAG: hypothetical protein AVDCRST_MAG68-3252, partial [uncultured Gemmatimonadetes bacterium]